MKIVFLLLLLVGFVDSAQAQLDTESTPPDQDQNDLFARAAASRVVIIGTVTKSEGIAKNLSPDALAEHLRNGTAAGGSLVTVRVDETVCRQSDFDKTAPRVDADSELYLFIPLGESDLPNGRYREVVLPGHRYLLLLDSLDTRSLTVKYRLDPNRAYYRGEEQNRGVIPLDTTPSSGHIRNPPEVVDEFRKLCAAMTPVKPEDKVSSLQQLVDSGDPILAKEAMNAQKAVRSSMAPGSPRETKPN
jgi:hypothetical protein